MLLARIGLFAVGLALAGCASASSANDGKDDSAAISANEAAAQGDFKQHLVTAMPASAENQSTLGIMTWDAFAGSDAKSGFVGAVFYASDANGDVRYAFQSDIKTRKISVAVLEKDGTASADQSVDLNLLLADIARLGDAVKAQQRRPPRFTSRPT